MKTTEDRGLAAKHQRIGKAVVTLIASGKDLLEGFQQFIQPSTDEVALTILLDAYLKVWLPKVEVGTVEDERIPAGVAL